MGRLARIGLGLWAACAALAVGAAEPASDPSVASGPNQAALAEAVQLGTVAAGAQVCGLRDEAWAFDLRRAALGEATGTARPDDEALRAAPGRAAVEAALSYAETEALEDFAEAPRTHCAAVARSPELPRADRQVDTFRASRTAAKAGS